MKRGFFLDGTSGKTTKPLQRISAVIFGLLRVVEIGAGNLQGCYGKSYDSINNEEPSIRMVSTLS